MTRISKPKRRSVGAKRLDLTDMRELLRDRRVWSAMGVVTKADGQTTHWEIVPGDDGNPVDVIVDVVIQPSGVPVTARLRAGLWEVPSEGDEVALLIPDGAVDFMPVIIARLSTNSVPTVQGPEPGKLVIVNGQVLVHDGAGGAVSLALKSDVVNVDNKYADHIHLAPNGSTGGPLSTTVPNPPNPSFPAPDSVHPFLTVPGGVPTTNPESEGAGLDAATITGTSVLLGK